MLTGILAKLLVHCRQRGRLQFPRVNGCSNPFLPCKVHKNSQRVNHHPHATQKDIIQTAQNTRESSERERQREKEGGKERVSQRKRETEREGGRERERESKKERERQRDRERERQRDKEGGRVKERELY